MNVTWKCYKTTLFNTIDRLTVNDVRFSFFDAEDAFALWASWSRTLMPQGTMYLIGNGASASMASHFATDIAKNAGINTHVFTDLSLITAIGNDIGYDQSYAEPLRWRAKETDMLVAISSSGNSVNILNACHVARERQLKIVTLSAMSEDNTLRKQGDLNFYVPASTYGYAESGHATILHYWTDILVHEHTAYLKNGK